MPSEPSQPIEPMEFEPLMQKIWELLDAMENGDEQQRTAAVAALRTKYGDYLEVCRRAHVVPDP